MICYLQRQGRRLCKERLDEMMSRQRRILKTKQTLKRKKRKIRKNRSERNKKILKKKNNERN